VIRTLGYAPYSRAAKASGDDPDYPDSLLTRHLPGEVDFEFTLGPEGHLQGLKILWATHADFIRPALIAVDHWTFRPAQQGDLAVTATLQAALEFDVLDSKRVDVLTANGITLQDDSRDAFDARPRLKIVVDPVYPYDLRLAGREGEAVVDFTIGTNGRAEAMTVREATEPAFGGALVAALDCWMFGPAAKDGTALPVKATARWRYSLAPNALELYATERLVQRLRSKDTADMGAKGLDGQLHPIHQIPPVYPAACLRERPTGEALIEFIIDREGRCRLARVVSATREEFGWAAATAIERWVFDPPKRGGQPTDLRVSIPVRFSPPS
jgi:TonB family protein